MLNGGRFMIDIKMSKDIRRNCYEDILASVLKFWKREYQLCFLETWGFKFTNTSASIGAGLDPQKGNIEKAVDEYCGVTIEWNSFSLSEIENIKNEISQGMPVCIRIDKYNCPWSNCYYEKKGRHHCLVVGIDWDDEILCNDPFYDVIGEQLPKADLLNGCSDYAVFKVKKQYNVINNWRELVYKMIQTMNCEKTFIEMGEFARRIGKMRNFNKEHKYADDPWFYPLFVKLRVLANGRKLASQTLKYISQKFGVPQLNLVGDMLEQCGNLWLKVHSLLLKECYKKNAQDKVFKTAEEKIIEISNMEKTVLLKIKEIIQGKMDKIQCNENNLNILNVIKSSKIDLNDYFNNKTFYKQGMEITNYMSKIGHFIYSDENILGTDERVDKEFDNIQCREQIIKIPGRLCKYLYIAAFSDFSSEFGIFEIIYSNGNIEKMELDIPNWIFPECRYDYVINVGKAGRYYQGNTYILKQTANLYVKQVSISEQIPIIAIKLPENPSIHVVDIYMS